MIAERKGHVRTYRKRDVSKTEVKPQEKSVLPALDLEILDPRPERKI